jgi:hypothetical protein
MLTAIGLFAAFGTAETSVLTPHIRTAKAFGTRRFRRAVPAISCFAAAEWPDRLAGEGLRRLKVRSLVGHARLKAQVESHGDMFEKIERSLERIERKLDGKADK